ncbi:MAG: DUF177 domain-containing protein [Ruminococcaceae bacterium]|nr:DUF177 domain-containing protein [Oscillospiraceae bacterium]
MLHFLTRTPPQEINEKVGVLLKIDVTELMNHRSDEIKFDYTFDPAHTDVPCVEMPSDVTIAEGGIRVVGELYDTLGSMMFKAHVTVNYTTPCARCLDDAHALLEFDVERMVITDRSSLSNDDHLTDDGEWDGEGEDVICVNEARIIPDADIMEEISLSLPSFVLCSEDCPGLCPKCGKHLRDGDCGCKEEKYINPKLAILQKLLENQE